MRARPKLLLASASIVASLGATGCVIHDDPGYYGYYTRPHSYHREVRYRDDRDRHREYRDNDRWDRRNDDNDDGDWRRDSWHH